MNTELHQTICEAIRCAGGRALLVGGCVRDRLLGREPEDIDCEVYGLAPQALCALLRQYGEVDMSGAAFGVYTLRREGFDFALPRVERRTGEGHASFSVTPMPGMTPHEAAARRDFTVNAILQDALTGEIIDPYGGAADLKEGVLRAVPGGQFHEDPLRVLRGAQFAARFGLRPEAGTLAAMRNMPLHALSAQRVWDETKKALLAAPRPGDYFRVLRDAGALCPWFAELRAQAALDRATALLDRAAAMRPRAAHPLGLMLAAMTLALPEDGAKALLHRLSVPRSEAAYGESLAAEAGRMRDGLADEARALLIFDACACPGDLTLLCAADGMEEELLAVRLARYGAAVARPMPDGRMLLAAGATPGPDMKRLLRAARDRTLMGMDAEDAVRQVMKPRSPGRGGRTKDGTL